MKLYADLIRELSDAATQLARVCRTAENQPAAYVRDDIHRAELKVGDALEVAHQIVKEAADATELPTTNWRNVASELLERSAITLTISIVPPAR